MSVPQDNGEGFPLLYTVEQTAELLNVGRDKIFELIRTGQLASFKLGRSRRIAPHHIEALFKGLDKENTQI